MKSDIKMTESISRVSCIIGTAGHIDHGKTSLVKALTGIDTDRLIEEKKRGVSIDLGFAYMDFKEAGAQGFRAAIVDVPGHERFIKNMLAGVTGIDMVLFVVAADDGIMPQTREHLDIVHLLGVKKGIFVITKADLAGADRIEDVKEAVRALIDNTTLKGSPIVTASVVNGAGIEELKSLIKKSIEPRKELSSGFFRLPIDRAFAVKGFGTVVTGTVASGKVKKGEDVLCFPTGAKAKIRGIQSLYLNAEDISAGERAALNITGIDYKDMERGYILASPELQGFSDYAGSKRPLRLDCTFEFLKGKETRGKAATLRSKNLKVHHLTGESLARIQFPKGTEAGGRVFGRLVLQTPLLMLKGDHFILRDSSVNETIGGGVVHIPYLSRQSMPKMENAHAPAPGAPMENILSGLLPERGVGFVRATLSLMLSMREAELTGSLSKAGMLFSPLGPYIVNVQRLEAFKKKLTDALSAYHKANPTEAGIKEEALFKAVQDDITAGLGREKGAGLFKDILEGLIAAKAVKREGSAIALYTHRPALQGKDALIENALLSLFKSGESITTEELKKLPFRKEELDKIIAYLQRGGAIVRIREGCFVSGDFLGGSKAKLIEHIRAKGSIKASEFRDILGCGRKLAIELLEYFDKERVTLRQGDIRTLRI